MLQGSIQNFPEFSKTKTKKKQKPNTMKKNVSGAGAGSTPNTMKKNVSGEYRLKSANEQYYGATN